MKMVFKTLTVIAGLCSFQTHADVSFSFALNGPDIPSNTKTLSISRFFARIDDPAKPETYLLYQAGKFFPLFRVNTKTASYTRLTPEVKPTLRAGIATAPEPEQLKSSQEAAEMAAAEALPATPVTALHLTKAHETIAGVRCRVVEELQGDQTILKHCMADQVRLGITERETRTLARLFKMARERDFGWLGTSTDDELFVSISSQDLQTGKTLQLTSHSTKPLPVGYLRVPKTYKQVNSE